MRGTITRLKVDQITLDPRCQSRVSVPDGVVDEYVSAMRTTKLPAPVVYSDGKSYWLADGHLRLEAPTQQLLEQTATYCHRPSRH